MRNCSEAQSPQHHRVVVFILYFLIVFFGLGGDFWIDLDSLHENEDLMMNFWAIQESQITGKSWWPLASFGQNAKNTIRIRGIFKNHLPQWKLPWQGGTYTVENPTSHRGVGYSFDSKSYINARVPSMVPIFQDEDATSDVWSSDWTQLGWPQCRVSWKHVHDACGGQSHGKVERVHCRACFWCTRHTWLSEKSPARPSGWSPMEEISQIPFFRSLSYKELPMFGDTSTHSRLERSWTRGVFLLSIHMGWPVTRVLTPISTVK